MEIATQNVIFPGSVGLAQAHPLTKPLAMGDGLPPGLVQLRSTLPIRALVLGMNNIFGAETTRMNVVDVDRWKQLTFCSCFYFSRIYFPASGQALVTGVVPTCPRFLPSTCYRAYVGFSNPTARRFFIELLTHALALSASPFVHLSRKSPTEFIRVCTRRGSNSRK